MKKGFTRHGGLRSTKNTFFITAGIIAAVAILCFTGLSIPGIIDLKGVKDIRFGIDIRGGFEAIMAPAASYTGEVTDADLEAAKNVVELRMDNLKITDREVFIDTQKRIVIRSPWKSGDTANNADEALKELGEMALLTFKDPDGNVVIEGKDVKDAYAAIDPDTNSPIVVLSLNSDGKTKFATATAKLVGKPISINMDETQISNPTVDEAITGGEAIINGMESIEAAKDLAEKIKAGSLPFALEAITSNQISASLGGNALDVVVQAGIFAFILICLFMLLYYRLPGFVAVFALSAQLAGQLLAISVPQFTLTLPGIAAIILSIGMGVDANIIISERIKEEIRAGNPIKISLRNGFDRAFSAVLDGNVTVAISAALLMIFGSGSFMSFGYSLLTGVILNGLCGVTASRLMIGSLSRYEGLQSKWLYGGKKEVQ
ncbi:MAG: protein translocase subunit SecD [Saccharofermentanales bacterium]